MKKIFVRTLLILSLIVCVGVAAQSLIVASYYGKAVDSVGVSPTAQAKNRNIGVLTCPTVRERTREFLKLHYSFRTFNVELSQRSFSKYFQILDPGKMFFLQSDIDSFRGFEKTLGDVVERVDCRFVSDVYALFLKRVTEADPVVENILKTPFDYNIDESIETDRKKLLWAKTPVELADRWRKQLKFSAMMMKETEKDDKVVSQRLRKRFQLMRRNSEEKTPDEVNAAFVNAFAAALDPHSQYMLPEDQDDFQLQLSLHFFGIGATLSGVDGYTVVEGLVPGGPASRDGRLRKGDKIVAVDSGDGSGFTDVVDMDLSKVVQLIRGKKNTLVKLNILRKDEQGAMEQMFIDIVRDEVRLADGEAKSDVLEVGGKKIGIINLPSFYLDYKAIRENSADFRSSSRDMVREIEKLKAKKVDGMVLDLRRNGGGDLSEGVRITGLFIDNGPVVQVENRNHDVESYDDSDREVAWAGPLAVLVGRQTASASEILANALKDYGRAIILGDSRTYGKATVQSVSEIPGSHGRENDGALRVTISKFYSPAGRSNQEKGVPADLVIPNFLEMLDIGEGENEYALPYTTITPQRNFKAIQDIVRIFDPLRKSSLERVAKSKEFQELQERMKKAENEREKTLLSLKIDKKKEDKKAIASPTPGVKATGTATPIAKPIETATPVPDISEMAKVVQPDDIQLREATNVLVDAMNLLGKADWTK